MKKKPFCLLLLVLSLYLFCCSPEKKEAGKILAKINNYALTIQEFQYQLAAELEFSDDYKLTKEAKKEFLERLIRKELLIQEAKKQQLDRREKFVKAIERYWEATLIRDLMEMQGKEIRKRILIPWEKIEIRYQEMKLAEKKLPSLSVIKEDIVADLEEKKGTAMLEGWINDLRKNAKININQELLDQN